MRNIYLIEVSNLSQILLEYNILSNSSLF